eukprot:TRINITY_DN29681_c0_g1_i1.p1 TRINITY_DN29681_c0_g1~~TRINITY_DN29681_c0_g1_i1.p1  ORF type:complete len:350 (+),score=71.69 TRINITY_DN29681_c0_g1_i1:61-1050(+)
MGSGASADKAHEMLEKASAEEVMAALRDLAPGDIAKLKEALSPSEASAKGDGKGKPPLMEKVENPFPEPKGEKAVDITDDPSHKIKFEDDEKCVRVYEPKFSKPGEVSEVHYHDAFTAYLFIGNPDTPQVDTCMEMCQEMEGGGLKTLNAFKMQGFPGGFCSCIFFPHPMFGERVVHRVGVPAAFPDQSAERQPFHQLGCEIKAWPKAATPEALPPKTEGPSLPEPYMLPPMSPKTAKLQQWSLVLRAGEKLPAHAFSFPAMILCGCNGGGKLKAAEGGPADSPLLGLATADHKWLPAGCAAVGPLELPADAEEPLVVSVIELLKEGLC